MSSTPEPQDGPPDGPDIRDGDGFLYIAREIVVDADDVSLVADELQNVGAVSQQVGPALDGVITLYRVPEGVDVPRLVERLRRLPGEPRVSPNHVLYGGQDGVQPNIVLVGQPKYHGGAPADPWPAPALPPSAGGSGQPVRVAVIDTGIDPNAQQRPLLQGRLNNSLLEPDPIYIAGQQIDVMGGHGTMVAGIIAR